MLKRTMSLAVGVPPIVRAEDSGLIWTSFWAIQVSVTVTSVPNAASRASSLLRATALSPKTAVSVVRPVAFVHLTRKVMVPSSQPCRNRILKECVFLCGCVEGHVVVVDLVGGGLARLRKFVGVAGAVGGRALE